MLTLALALTVSAALPSSASTLQTPPHKAQQEYQRAMKGILPEDTAAHRSAVVKFGEVVCYALRTNYGVTKFVSQGTKDGLSKAQTLVAMGLATALFCPRYHSEVEKVIDQQPG